MRPPGCGDAAWCTPVAPSSLLWVTCLSQWLDNGNRPDVSSRPCPGCVDDDGVFLRPCGCAICVAALGGTATIGWPGIGVPVAIVLCAACALGTFCRPVPDATTVASAGPRCGRSARATT